MSGKVEKKNNCTLKYKVMVIKQCSIVKRIEKDRQKIRSGNILIIYGDLNDRKGRFLKQLVNICQFHN